MKKAVKIAKTIFDILCWILIIVLVLSVITSVISKFNGATPSFFGYSILRVSSGSMEPELEVGDVIISKSFDDPMNIKVGDIVTYKGSGELSGMLITHEVIVAPENIDGEVMLQTKGTANDVPDAPINADRVVSVYICEVEFLRVFFNYFFSPWGLLTIIALIVLIFIDEVIALIKNLTGNTSKPKAKNIDEIIGRIQKEADESGKNLK